MRIGLACLTLGAVPLVYPVRAQGVAPAPILTAPVDARRWVRLRGNTRPEANARNDRGRVPDELPLQHMQLVLRRSAECEAALQQYLRELHDRRTPNYHRWLSASQFRERFGLAAQDIAVIKDWLAQQGFTVNEVYSGATVIDFSGTAGQVRTALHTEIHDLDVRGVHHIANMSDPEIPQALAPAVRGIVSLHDFAPHPYYRQRPAYTYINGSSTFYAVVPADLAVIYNLNPLFSAGTSGKGQTIAVLEDTDLPAAGASDWSTFRSTFGLSAYSAGSLSQTHPGGCSHDSVTGDQFEAELDMEWASAAAPSATIEVASCASGSTSGVLIALQNLINSSNPPSVISISYGLCETLLGSANAALDQAYAQAVTEGISVFVAAGDAGAALCDDDQAAATHGIGVSGFASTPNNVAVGGTDFGDTYAGSSSTYWSGASSNGTTYGSALSYVPEIPWNDSCASSLLVQYYGYSSSYGSGGLCNSSLGENNLTTSAGSGGSSGCATGTPSISSPEVVSGSCAGYAKPSWQAGVGVPTDGVRDLPDVSLFAGNGFLYHIYVVCDSAQKPCSGAPSTWSSAGGTSFAAPVMAGIQALIDETYGSQGNPNNVYYRLAASQARNGTLNCSASAGRSIAGACVFHDVTQGDNDVNCTGAYDCYDPSGTNGALSGSSATFLDAYAAGTGWNFATGVGSVNAANLIKYWNSADVSLAVTGTALGSGLLSYSLQLGNTGPQSAASVVVTSTLPSGVTLVSSSGSVCTQSGLTLSCAIGNLSPNAASAVTVVLQPGGLSSVSLKFTASTTTDSNLDLNNDVASIVLAPAGNASESGTSDGPLPLWAVGALGAGLIGTAARRLNKVA